MAVLLSKDGEPVLAGVYGPREHGVSILLRDRWEHCVLSTAHLFDPLVPTIKRIVAREYTIARAIIIHPKDPGEKFKCTTVYVDKLDDVKVKSFPTYDAAAMYCHMLVR